MTPTQLNRKLIQMKRELDKLDKWFDAFDKECARLLRKEQNIMDKYDTVLRAKK